MSADGARGPAFATAGQTVALIEMVFGPDSEEATFARIMLDKMGQAGDDTDAFFVASGRLADLERKAYARRGNGQAAAHEDDVAAERAIAMAVRRRGKRWVADYYDAFRIRRWKTFGTKDEAVTFAAQEKVRATEDGGLAPVVDPDVSMTVYAEKWLKDCEARGVKPKTITRCESAPRLHVLPRLGGLSVRRVSRPAVRQLLLAKLAEQDGSRQGLRPSL